MKRTAYIILCALLAVSAGGAAAQGVDAASGATKVDAASGATQTTQTADKRTTATIVADVLAQMPARDAEVFEAQMADLASAGGMGVMRLVRMLDGEGPKAPVEYALSGLSHWVSAPGREAERLATSQAYIRNFERVKGREGRAFIIRQLGIVGKEEAVEALTAFLADESLKEPATAALASIGAIAPPWHEATTIRVPVGGDDRIPALYAKMAAKPANATKLLQKALKNGDRKYRFAALDAASDYADGAMYSALAGSLRKARPAAAADILNWLGDECDRSTARRAQIVPLAGAEARRLLATDDIETVAAAARLLAKVGGSEAIVAMADRMGQVVVVSGSADMQRREDEKIGAMVDVLAAALASTKGDVASAVAPLAGGLGEAGSVAALRLLALRKATAHSGAVFAQLSSSTPAVRAAAYNALADVVGTGDLDRLNTIMGSAATDELPAVQRAMTAAAAEMPAAERYAAAQRLMNAAPTDKQYLYYPLLAATGDRKALATITERFDSESGTAKDAAFTALTGWQGVAAARKLLAIARDPAATPYFDRALARYTAIAGDPSQGGETRAAMLADALSLAKTDAQKRAALGLVASTGSYPGMAKAGEYLADANKGVANAAAVTVMTIALANTDFTGAEVRGFLTRAADALDNADADYQRKAIAKHLDEMVDAEPFALSDEERAEGFTVLFDGSNLDQWTGNKTDYRVQSGTIALYPSRGSGGNLYTAREYGNFVFRFEFQITPGANNGVGIRAEQGQDAAYHGMEIQILDHDHPAYADITTHQVHGSVYGVIGARRAALKPQGEWNVEEIVADGDHIRVTLNGEVILDGNIRTASRGGTFDGREHPGLFNKRGYIGFLGHGSQLKFRNIRIRELK